MDRRLFQLFKFELDSQKWHGRSRRDRLFGFPDCDPGLDGGVQRQEPRRLPGPPAKGRGAREGLRREGCELFIENISRK